MIINIKSNLNVYLEDMNEQFNQFNAGLQILIVMKINELV